MRHWSNLFAMVMALVTLSDLAWAGDREVAQQIAAKLQQSGQLRGYDIRVKFEDGTVWLRGRVATQSQMNTALALASQTKGVTEIANGLVIRQESAQRPKVAPIAPNQPVDYAVQHARLAPRAASLAPIPSIAPNLWVSVASEKALGESEDRPPQVAEHEVPPTTESAQESTLLVNREIPPELPPVVPIRRLEFSATLEALPATAQKAGYWACSRQMHVPDLHLATSLTGYAEPMLLPDESGVSSGEVIVSDDPGELCELPTSGDAETASAPVSPVGSPEQPKLIQRMPEPARRQWTGNPRDGGFSLMRASVDDPK
ncbi:MAG: BON domain-containing protein [Planctomycetaceae bacterium]|nr:BON domain-containing protein [Planctomycetaceae bacterium]